MQSISFTQLTQPYDHSDRVAPLQPIATVAEPADQATAATAVGTASGRDPAAAVSPGKADQHAQKPDQQHDAAHVVNVVGEDQRSLEVRYSLDSVSNVWVASVLDSQSGEVVRTVPAKRVLHQLAELGHTSHVDRHA